MRCRDEGPTDRRLAAPTPLMTTISLMNATTLKKHSDLLSEWFLREFV